MFDTSCRTRLSSSSCLVSATHSPIFSQTRPNTVTLSTLRYDVDPVETFSASFYLHPSSFSYFGSNLLFFSFFGGLHRFLISSDPPTYWLLDLSGVVPRLTAYHLSRDLGTSLDSIQRHSEESVLLWKYLRTEPGGTKISSWIPPPLGNIWSPPKKENKGKEREPRIGQGGREEVCSSSHRGYPCGQREGMMLTPVHDHHDTCTVPITTSTEQELTPVFPWQRTGLEGRGSYPQHR
jgi:hypothetical protein